MASVKFWLSSILSFSDPSCQEILLSLLSEYFQYLFFLTPPDFVSYHRPFTHGPPAPPALLLSLKSNQTPPPQPDKGV